MVRLQIYSGCPPFHGWSVPDIVRAVSPRDGQRPERPNSATNGLTDALWELIQECWDDNPSKRPTIEEVWRKLRRERRTTKTRGSRHYKAPPDWNKDTLKALRPLAFDMISLTPTVDELRGVITSGQSVGC